MTTTYESIHVTQLRAGDRIVLDYGCMCGSDDAIVRSHYSDKFGMGATVEIIGGANDGGKESITGFSSKAIGWRRA